MDADAVEIRVLGCLIEKQRTTPDQHPLSLNALRLACNQSTNRDPVVAYDERTIKGTLDGWTEADFAVRLPRRPGQKDDRYAPLLGGDEEDGPRATEGPAPPDRD